MTHHASAPIEETKTVLKPSATATPQKMSLLPGLALTCAVALLASWLHTLPIIGVFSALILAIVLGMALRNTIALPEITRPGIAFTLKRVLRLALMLLGFQLSFGEIRQLGISGFGVVAMTLTATFLFTVWLGRRMGIEEKLCRLIAAGTSICGASAVVAANVVIKGRDEDVAYSVAIVTVFGSASMFIYPFLPHLLHLTHAAYGLWAGASIHEVAQVVAATFQDGTISGQTGTISKLTRVMLLAPMILALSIFDAKSDTEKRGLDLKHLPIPWFVFGFIAVIGLNSLHLVPNAIRMWIVAGNQFLLALSLAAMGLETSIVKLRQEGGKPFLLGASAWLFISFFSYALVRLLN